MNSLLTTMVICLGVLPPVSSWFYPDRADVRTGNKQYEKGDYAGAKASYNEALVIDPSSAEALFNLSNVYYREHQFDSVLMYTSKAAEAMKDNAAGVSAAYYNAGNALFQQKKLEEALESYKNALRKNPNDMDAKFNLAYVQKLLEEQNKDDDKKDQDKKDKDKDKDKDKQDQQDKDNRNNQDKDKPQDGENPPPQDKEEQQAAADRQQAERMLNAMQAEENKTQQKVNEQKAAGAKGYNGKNW